ncbi:MAG: DMT family transporter, partial [Pseudomonadota bacterium]
GVASAMCFGGVLVIGRAATDRDGPDAVFFSSSLIVAVATLPPALFFWEIPVAAAFWGLLALVVAGSAMRSYADIRAYAIGDAGFLAPFNYLRLITVGVAGYVMFDETIDGATGVGGAIIIAATLYIAIRESQLRREARARAAAGAVAQTPRAGPKAEPPAGPVTGPGSGPPQAP